jgi:hypothetical protein
MKPPSLGVRGPVTWHRGATKIRRVSEKALAYDQTERRYPMIGIRELAEAELYFKVWLLQRADGKSWKEVMKHFCARRLVGCVALQWFDTVLYVYAGMSHDIMYSKSLDIYLCTYFSRSSNPRCDVC